jgi:hypothetical protein
MSIFFGIPLISNKLNELYPENSQYGTNSHNCNADCWIYNPDTIRPANPGFRTIIDFQRP